MYCLTDRRGKRGAFFFCSDRTEENVAVVSEYLNLAGSLPVLTNKSRAAPGEIYKSAV